MYNSPCALTDAGHDAHIRVPSFEPTAQVHGVHAVQIVHHLGVDSRTSNPGEAVGHIPQFNAQQSVADNEFHCSIVT